MEWFDAFNGKWQVVPFWIWTGSYNNTGCKQQPGLRTEVEITKENEEESQVTNFLERKVFFPILPASEDRCRSSCLSSAKTKTSISSFTRMGSHNNNLSDITESRFLKTGSYGFPWIKLSWALSQKTPITGTLWEYCEMDLLGYHHLWFMFMRINYKSQITLKPKYQARITTLSRL